MRDRLRGSQGMGLGDLPHLTTYVLARKQLCSWLLFSIGIFYRSLGQVGVTIDDCEVYHLICNWIGGSSDCTLLNGTTFEIHQKALSVSFTAEGIYGIRFLRPDELPNFA